MAQTDRISTNSIMAGGSDFAQSMTSTTGLGSDFVQSMTSTIDGGSDFAQSMTSTTGSGSDFVQSMTSTIGGGSDFTQSKTSTTGFGSDFVQSMTSTIAGGSDFAQSKTSTTGIGSDFVQSMTSAIVGGSDFVQSITSTIDGGSDFVQSIVPNRNVRMQYMRSIMVNANNDITGWISGMVVVMPGKSLIVVDRANSSLKLIDLTLNTLLSHVKLTGKLWDITKVTCTQVAFTSYSEHAVIFVNVSNNTLELNNKVKVNGQCVGIACINDTLVVSYDKPVKVEILSKSGQVLKAVVTERTGSRLFSEPCYVEVSRDQAQIYISDYQRSAITKLSMAGEVLATFQDDKIVKFPLGMAVDKSGSVNICAQYTDDIVQLEADLTHPRTLKGVRGVPSPRSVCYCQETDSLYIGKCGSDYIDVFKFKYV